MQKKGLLVKGLVVQVGQKTIIKGLDLEIGSGEAHAIMGPNGSGKSTLAQAVAGNPDYAVSGGELIFNGKSIVGLEPNERAQMGIFLSFQYPLEIPGVNVASFLRMVYNARVAVDDNKKAGESVSPVKFRELLEERMRIVDLKSDFMERGLNEGFSGGEKKKMEVLQMLVLEPDLVILDEVDSGLDVDALKSVASGISWLRRKNSQAAFVIITHYARILHYIRPDYVHIMQDGRIVKSGGFEVAQKLERDGYKEFGSEDAAK